MTKEQKFYKALQDVFIGAKIEGKGGFVNLMRIKSNYYRKIEDILKKDIETALKTYPSFRDELFDKLYSFFSRYFTESGSIYFNSTPFHNNIYEKVYTDEKDVILFWKTQMLYYVKTDRIFRSLPVEFPSDRGVDAKGGQGAFKFYFDATKIENKKANEKRSLIFELNKILEDDTIVFDVQYSEKGRRKRNAMDKLIAKIRRLQKVAVLATQDRSGNMLFNVVGFQKVRQAHIEKILTTKISKNGVICSDDDEELRNIQAKELRRKELIKNKKSKNDLYGLTAIEKHTGIFVNWINYKFKGVATKYLQSYIMWYIIKHKYLLKKLIEDVGRMLNLASSDRQAWYVYMELRLNPILILKD